MEDAFGLRGKAVLVAGAGGLGGAIVAAFVDQGARVVVVDRDEQPLTALDARSGLSTAGGGPLVAELSDPDGCNAVVTDAIHKLGCLDIFVHAVGVNVRKPVLEVTDDEWSAVMSSNLSTAFWLGRAAGAVMREQKHGRQVYLSSVSSVLAHENHAPYAASKGGLNQLIRVMAREWAVDGIGVNAIAPGYIETSLTADYLSAPGVRAGLETLVPAGRLGRPEDVAGAALFLSSHLASFITGQVLCVDGGRTLV